ncbi:hypothetical protein IMZ11_03895 [Microtetraspora sp. AC03309]|uniref:hypothetical protein n=1 Tax=Microtetraspora sp. AC03309 TaxID=2779376 RepID=UPI001E5CCDDF|nr:hypothetical protein [Microtetraspora sp. AC03309]MCC5574779.1 hypothetical protein [Microtetraspora sp. AC03309]
MTLTVGRVPLSMSPPATANYEIIGPAHRLFSRHRADIRGAFGRRPQVRPDRQITVGVRGPMKARVAHRRLTVEGSPQ